MIVLTWLYIHQAIDPIERYSKHTNRIKRSVSHFLKGGRLIMRDSYIHSTLLRLPSTGLLSRNVNCYIILVIKKIKLIYNNLCSIVSYSTCWPDSKNNFFNETKPLTQILLWFQCFLITFGWRWWFILQSLFMLFKFVHHCLQEQWSLAWCH